MKRKLLLATALVASALGMRAQTDVTSTYLTNADFSASTPTTNDIRGYGKDGTPYGFQTVDGWTPVVTAGDNGTASYPNSGMAAGVFSYGSTQQLKGNNKTAPATNPNGVATGNCFGFFGVWGCGGYYYQEVTLLAGKYTITVPMYNQSGTQANITYTGFFPTSGTESTVNVNPTVGQWVNQSVTFTLDSDTEGQIRIGYQSTGSGSSANPHIFIDCVKIEYTDPQAAEKAEQLAASKYTLNGYIKKATALNSVLSDATLTTAIGTAQGVYDAATDFDTHNAGVVSASSDLLGAINTALSSATAVALSNGDFNTTPNNTLNADGTTTFGGTLSTATSNPDNTKAMSANTGDHGYLYDVTGWTQYSKFNSTASQGTTSEYGTAMPANGWSTNSTTPPATDMIGSSTGAALHLSAGWGDQARYQQAITNLSSGRYVFYYEIINQYSNTKIASNYIGVNGTAGDFYGTTNGFVYSEFKTIEQGVWQAQAFEFDVAKTANINVSVGVTTSTGGSGDGAKLWIDNVLVYRIGDVMVTDDDATAIIANVDALNDVVYNATDKSELASAKSTFESSKTLDNYNALNVALAQAQASVAVYTALDAAITNVEDWTSDATSVTNPIRAKYTAGTYSNETTAADIYEEYQTAELAALAAASATDYTSVILNPSFETGDMTGWLAESRNDTGVKDQSNGTYSITSGDPVDGNKLFNSWGGTAENNVYQTIKGVPAGTYTLTALVAGHNGEELVLAANETTNSVTVAGDKTVGYTVNVVFTLDATTDVVIKASNTKSQEGSDASFIKADNFKLIAGDITTNDYTALNAAIAAAEANTLGFESGEYAPYNNVEAIATLAAAKAVDQSVAIAQTKLDGIVNSLTSAVWTANTEEVNAIYDGNFAIQEEHTTGPTALAGWNNPAGIRQLIKNTTTYKGLSTASANAAVFAWGGTTMTYGNTEGYTMPLAAHTIYELSFKTCGWIDGDMGYVDVTVLNSANEGMDKQTTATATKRINGAENPWDEFKILFVTGEAGNYTLGMRTSKHTTFTDIVLKKAASQVLEFADDQPTPTYAPGTYPTVKVTRTLKVDRWATAVYPFAVTFPAMLSSYATIATLNSFDKGDLNFVSGSNTANEPFLMRVTSSMAVNMINSSGITLTDVAVAAATPQDVEKDGATFKGTYSQIENLTSDATNLYYVVSENNLYKVSTDATKAATINPYRAYIQVPASAETKVRFVVDNEVATSIEGIEAIENVENGKIYDISGRLVTRPVKGLYIKNGKKFIVK